MNLLRRIPSFARRSAVSFGLRFGGLLLQFVGAILIARVLGAEGYGIYTYAFTVAIVMGSFLGCGFAPLAVRELPRYLSLRDYGLAWGFLISGFWLIFLSGTVAAVILTVLIKTGIVVLAISWPLVVVAAILQTLILGMSSTLNGFQRVIQSQFIETVIRQGMFLAAICGLALWGHAFLPTDLFMLALVMALLVVLLQVWRIRQAMLAETDHVLAAPAYDLRRWLIAALPLMGVGVLTQLQMSLDVLMLGALADSADVGRYRAAARGAEMVVIANGIALQLLEPMLSRAIALDNRSEAQQLVSHSAMVSVGLATALGLPLLVGAQYYLGLFGAEFVPASPVLQMLVCGYLLGFLCGPVAVILVMLGRERIVFAATLGGLVINLAINLVFIPQYGIFAAASATLISGVLAKLILLVVVLRSTPFDPTPGALFHRLRG
jgi:O-antigen/teichoic acid export membrane protein